MRGGCLALSLTVAVSFARAQTIIHTVPPQPVYYSYLAPSHDIDVNNDGIADFNLSTPNGIDILLSPIASNAVMAVPEVSPDIGAFVAALPSGTIISSSLSPALIWYDRNSPQGGDAAIVSCAWGVGCAGYFQNQTDAYAGVRLNVAGNVYYGWIHIQNLGLNAGQISDWAFETRPDTPIAAAAGIDSDQDGVPDELDQCPNTAPGAVVDCHGCSIEQLCPCDGPWKNHGEYVSQVQSVASRFVQEGLITESERNAIIKKAAGSDCGKRH